MLLLLRVTRRETALLELTLCNEGLFATLQLVEVGGHAVEHGFDFGLDFGEQGGLGVLEFWFRDEFKVLQGRVLEKTWAEQA